MRLRRQLALPIALGAAVTAGTLIPAAPSGAQAADLPRAICFPVEGRVTYTDTWGAPRSGGRAHEGQDLMGAKMLKLLATADGEIVLLRHQASGNYLYLRDNAGWIHAYIHINNDRPGTDDGSNRFQDAFAPGLRVGSKVKAGEFIAYLGDSGNAETTGAHLHYELRRPNGTLSGVAVNAYSSLRAATQCPTLPAGTGMNPISPANHVPFATPTAFVNRQTDDYFGRAPQGTEMQTYTGMFTTGSHGSAVVDRVTTNGRVKSTLNPVVRLYLGWMGRFPTTAEFTAGRNQMWGGAATDRVASRMLIETGAKSLTHEQFATQLLENVTGQPADPAEVQAIVARRNRGELMSKIVVSYTEVISYYTKTAAQVRLYITYTSMRGYAPHPDTVAKWIGRPNVELARALVTSEEYRRRISR